MGYTVSGFILHCRTESFQPKCTNTSVPAGQGATVIKLRRIFYYFLLCFNVSDRAMPALHSQKSIKSNMGQLYLNNFLACCVVLLFILLLLGGKENHLIHVERRVVMEDGVLAIITQGPKGFNLQIAFLGRCKLLFTVDC